MPLAYRGAMITGLDHLVLCVGDVERSVAWYAETLRLTPERLEEWRSGAAPFVSMRVNSSTIIDLFASEPDGRNVDHVAYVVAPEDFDRFVADHADELEGSPRDLFGARGIGRGVYLRDPDGHRVEIRTYDLAGGTR